MNKLLIILILALALTSCRADEAEEEYDADEIHTIPYGGTGELSEGDYSGDGPVTNTAGTTVIIEGNVTVDALSASGSVVVPAGSTLIVNTVLNVGGGGILDVKGTLITQSYTQVGNTYISYGKMSVSGKFTVGGGTTLYLENSEVEVGELVITGHIKAVDNSFTQAANWYSMIELTGAKYMNRGGGTKVCGPILFNSNNDNGASGVSLTDVTETALQNKATLPVVYGLPTDSKLYQYGDNCTPLTSMPEH